MLSPKIRHLPLGSRPLLEPNEEDAQPMQLGQTFEKSSDQPVLIPETSETQVPSSPPPPTNKATPYRPTQRPPIAFLTVCDDGRIDGEIIRIRGELFIIGRTEGDLRIPHDDLISSRHVEIKRFFMKGEYSWVVTDLKSTNGLFARVSRLSLSEGEEFIVGRGRYKFEPSTDGERLGDQVESPRTGSTRDWADSPNSTSAPALVELVSGGIGNRYVLNRSEYWIGSDPTCAIYRANDPFCESRHVRVFRDSEGYWQAEHNRSLNGLWLRVPQLTSSRGFAFQIGEQRFRLKVDA